MIHLNSNEFFLDSNSPITTELRSPQNPFPEHSHSFEEIIVVSGGNGIHVLNDVPMNLSKNYVCFVDKKDRHLFDDVDDLFLSNVLYERDKLAIDESLKQFMPATKNENQGWFINECTAQEVSRLITRLNIESHENTPESRYLSLALFQQLIVELWRGRVKDVHNLTYEDRVFYALSHINTNYFEPNELDVVADKSLLSSRQLTSMVKKLTGMNYNQYLHYTRARQAYSLLINTDKLITDIAFQVGYQDSNYFSTKFKQVFHRTPREIRQRLL